MPENVKGNKMPGRLSQYCQARETTAGQLHDHSIRLHSIHIHSWYAAVSWSYYDGGVTMNDL